MPLPYLDRPICELVELAPDVPVRAERICQSAAAGPSEPFVHFHDAHELVLFGRVAGAFITEERCYPLAPHHVVFIPSMYQHDFALAAGRRDWVLIQVDGAAGDAFMHASGLERLRQPFCARPDRALQRRLDMLAAWLVALDAGDALALPLASVLLRAAARGRTVEGKRRVHRAGSLRRLRPAIDRLRQRPASAPAAEQAARLCALSPAYFSRRFKQQVGMSWSEYVRTHRLHLASRRLLETDHSIASIARELGFATPSHFGELFHRRFGLTPREYRQTSRAPRRTPS